MTIVERSLQEIAGSLLITLPKSWSQTFQLKKGDKVKINITENGQLIVAPKITLKVKKQESVIILNEDFPRYFFREYFLGTSKIHVKVKQKKDKQILYRTIKKFMNVLILEEGDNFIILKCFQVHELSIDECLNRMYHLCCSLFTEEEGSPSDMQKKEMYQNLNKFYYLLVLQVRRYIDEGKFADQNEIGLLHAVDARMVAEKIKRIAEILLEPFSDKEVLIKTKELFQRSYLYFYNEKFEKTISLLEEEKKIERKLTKFSQENFNLRLLLRNIRYIAMLTR